MMWRLLVVLTMSGLGAALPASASAPDASIEDYLDRELPGTGIPGLAYAVVSEGEVTAVGARGVLRSGEDAPVTPETPFKIGSITKSFTAVAVLQLVEAGSVELDTEISEYLEEFAGQPAGDVTVRQLLSHTSGYSTLQGNARPTDRAGDADDLAHRAARLAHESPAHPPGERWEYSNANFEVLGRLVEVVSGEDYQSYVTAHLLEPIGMAHSFVADGEVHPSMATGHRPWFGTKRPLSENTTTRGTAPAGGIIASAGDVALYLQTMMNRRDDVLTAEDKERMMVPAGAASPGYGLGWSLDPTEDVVWHTGTTPGFEALAMMIPSQSAGVVVLVNGGNGVGFGETTELLTGVATTALGLEYAGEGSGLPRQLLFAALVLTPVLYLACMIWAWTHRGSIRAKSGAFGLFSLWFPLLTTAVGAWVILSLVPSLIGAPIGTIRLYQPDLGLAMTATAVAGVAWAVFRLAVAYTGKLRSGKIERSTVVGRT